MVKCAAGATLVQATAPKADDQFLTLHDDGQPQAEANTTRTGGRGLRNMRTRAEVWGGRLEADATAGGFCIRVWLSG